ncbi:MAG: hypothetical protein ABI402_11560 [Ferruginibacter sp.]
MKKIITIPFYFFAIIYGCKTINNDQPKHIEVLETIMEDIKPNTVSWLDSGKVHFFKGNPVSYNGTHFEYDSAILIDYWGYDDVVKEDFFPVNERGQWISTILNIKKNAKNSLNLIDSILNDIKTYNDTALADEAIYAPTFAIVYFKHQKILGQTAFGPTSLTVKSTILLRNNSFLAILKQKQFYKIEELFSDILTKSKQ